MIDKHDLFDFALSTRMVQQAKKSKGIKNEPKAWDLSPKACENRTEPRDNQKKPQKWIWNGERVHVGRSGTFSFFPLDGMPAFALDLGRNFVPISEKRGLVARFTSAGMASHAADNDQKVWFVEELDMRAFKERDLLLDLWRRELQFIDEMAKIQETEAKARFEGLVNAHGLAGAQSRFEHQSALTSHESGSQISLGICIIV